MRTHLATGIPRGSARTGKVNTCNTWSGDAEFFLHGLKVNRSEPRSSSTSTVPVKWGQDFSRLAHCWPQNNLSSTHVIFSWASSQRWGCDAAQKMCPCSSKTVTSMKVWFCLKEYSVKWVKWVKCMKASRTVLIPKVHIMTEFRARLIWRQPSERLSAEVVYTETLAFSRIGPTQLTGTYQETEVGLQSHGAPKPQSGKPVACAHVDCAETAQSLQHQVLWVQYIKLCPSNSLMTSSRSNNTVITKKRRCVNVCASVDSSWFIPPLHGRPCRCAGDETQALPWSFRPRQCWVVVHRVATGSNHVKPPKLHLGHVSAPPRNRYATGTSEKNMRCPWLQCSNVVGIPWNLAGQPSNILNLKL